MKRFVTLSLLLLSFNTYAASTNLIVNGSFEDTSVNSGSWGVYKNILGWTTVSGPGIEIRDNVVGTTDFGSQFVELDSHDFRFSGAQNRDPNNQNVITNSAMQQIVQTNANQSYQLSFYYSPRIGLSSNTNGISVFWTTLY